MVKHTPRSATGLVRTCLLMACASACTAVEGEQEPTEDEPFRFSVDGSVVDLDGNPVVDAFVTVSTDYCIPDRTAADGTFEVGEVDPGPKRLITYGETAGNGLFASVVFAFEAESVHTFQAPVRVPRLDEIHPIDPDIEQVIETVDGLSLTIEAGSLVLAPFAPSEIQVARVPVAMAPPFIPDGVVLVDLFALHPILSTLDPPAAAVFPDSGLTTGTPVVFHALDYDIGELVPVATGTVDAQGRPTTAAGEGISELTWVGVSVASR